MCCNFKFNYYKKNREWYVFFKQWKFDIKFIFFLDSPLELEKCLPKPKKINVQAKIIEESDEFLTKKEFAIEKPPAKVKITIPSLSKFKTLESEQTKSPRTKVNKGSGLLSYLPKPRCEISTNKIQTKAKPNTCFIPESVQKRNTLDTSLETTALKYQLKVSDSEDETDYFSLERQVDLPEVNINELNEMVSKKTAKFAGLSTKVNYDEPSKCTKKPTFSKDEAIKALSGHKEAKRCKMDEVEFIEISGEQVLPNRSEWYRNALASSTSYQRRGIVDEENEPGTRRKNQITYLANQAVANDNELQAMWSENRANRRATQNKYGF